MNLYNRFKKWIIGDALASTEDIFEQVRIDVLFSFTLFFFLLNLPYVIMTLTMSVFHICIGIFSSLALMCVILLMRYARSIWPATIMYVCVHTFLNLFHFTINNGEVELQGILFFMLIVVFSFLMLNRKWGWFFTVFIGVLSSVGIYNVKTHYSLFHIAEKYHDPVPSSNLAFLHMIPLIINAYLISKFVGAKQKAEMKINEQRVALAQNNKILAMKNEDIVSSISYAKRIQYAVLPNQETITRVIPLSFIIYNPRDIVSGDFFWFNEIDSNNYIIACADCTGHGVPGAFMTVIGSNALTQIVAENKITSPGKILEELDNRVTHTLKQERTHYGLVNDGMDISIVRVNKVKREFICASAKRTSYFFRNGALTEFRGSKNSIGGLRDTGKTFSETTMNYQEDDMLYLFTDGVVDQFGGASNKKFTSKRLREQLLSIHAMPVNDQKEFAERMIREWKGVNEQTDDVLLIGIRF